MLRILLAAVFDEVGGGRTLSLFVGAGEVALVGATTVNVSVLETNPLPTIVLFLAAAFVAAPAARRAPATTPAVSR